MRSANLIDSLPDAICVVDTSANIKQWNKQFMRKFFGCPSGIFAVGSNIVKGNFVYDVLHPDHRHRFASAINTLRTSHRLDGEIRCVALRFSISYTKGPNVTGKYGQIDAIVI